MLKRYTLRLQCASGLKLRKQPVIGLINYRYIIISILSEIINHSFSADAFEAKI